jgi:hypothetical protein
VNGPGGESHLQRSCRNWFPVRTVEPAHLVAMEIIIDELSLDSLRQPLVGWQPSSLFHIVNKGKTDFLGY